MMPRGFDTLADYYRAHREEMELARAVGCTPIEARAELRRRAKARRDACGTRVPEQHNHTTLSVDPAPEFRAWESPWMMRD